jgi:hypothetical protein
MAQRARPDADVANDGWAPVPLYERVDEPAPDDASFVASPHLPPARSFAVRLARRAAPIAGPPRPGTAVPAHRLTVRMRGTCGADAVVTLFDHVRGEDRFVAARSFALTDRYADYELALTRREAARIEDYAALKVVVTAFEGSSSHSCSSSSTASSAAGSPAATSASGSASISVSSQSDLIGSGSSGRSDHVSSSSGLDPSNWSSSRSTQDVPRIYSPCCPNGIPSVLYLTITDAPGNVLNGRTAPLIYGAYDNPTDWTADFGVTSPDCAAEMNSYRTIFGCLLLPEPTWFFETAPGRCGLGGGTILVQSCDPFFMTGTGGINQGFSSPSCTWTITE